MIKIFVSIACTDISPEMTNPDVRISTPGSEHDLGYSDTAFSSSICEGIGHSKLNGDGFVADTGPSTL